MTSNLLQHSQRHQNIEKIFNSETREKNEIAGILKKKLLRAKQTYVITLCIFLENKSAVEETKDSKFEPPLCRALPLVGGSAGRLGTRCLRGAVAHQPPAPTPTDQRVRNVRTRLPETGPSARLRRSKLWCWDRCHLLVWSSIWSLFFSRMHPLAIRW